MRKAELNRHISAHKAISAVISTASVLLALFFAFWFMPNWAAWTFVVTYIYTDQYLTLKRLGDKPIP